VKVSVLPSAVAPGISPTQYATSFLVNDLVAIDAGCLGFVGSPQDQSRVRHILISHSHIDHVASLPIFLENAYEAKPDCVVVHGSAHVLESLQKDLFNGRLWPDFIEFSNASPHAPFLKLQQMEPGRPFEIEGLHILPVAVNHVVPTMGFVISDARGAFVIVSDTGPTDEIWRLCDATPNLRGIFLEVTFPNAMRALAEVSLHLTPEMFAHEIGKLHRPVPTYVVHVKARYQDRVLTELQSLQLPNMHLAQFGVPYEF